jgi:hypothetical protein
LTTLVKAIEVCGERSEEIQPNFHVICTEKPDHEGDHRTVYSVDINIKKGFEYSWKKK